MKEKENIRVDFIASNERAYQSLENYEDITFVISRNHLFKSAKGAINLPDLFIKQAHFEKLRRSRECHYRTLEWKKHHIRRFFDQDKNCISQKMAQRRSKRTAAATAESRIARAIEDESEDSNDSNYGADNNSVSSSDREEENISLDSAKKAKLDISEETLEQNINPNSINTKIDTANEDDDKKNQNVVKTKENNPGRESAEVSVKGRVCKSGRFWKSERDRFRSVIKSKGLKQNFKLEMKRKEDLKRVKAYEQSLKDSAKKEKEDLRARQEENKKKRDENQRKAEVYQEVCMNFKLYLG